MEIGLLYLDTSALTKLVVQERETDGLRAFVASQSDNRLVSSALARAELQRAVLRFAQRPQLSAAQVRGIGQEATALLRRIDLVGVSAVLLDRAGRQPPPALRTLDAIHLVTAMALGRRLKAIVVYDDRLASAAGEAGLVVQAPT